MEWPFEPTVYAGLVGLALGRVWLAGGRRLAWAKNVYFGLGVLCIWVALETPLHTLADRYLDSAHMFQHVLLGVVAPPLLLLGLDRRMAGSLLRLPGLRWAVEPIPAQVISGAVMIVWHLPAVYDATLYSVQLHVLEHVCFVAGGVVFWWPVIDATAAHCRWRMSPMAQLLYLFAGTFPQDAVALAFQFSRTSFYEYYTRVPRLVPALDPVTDQGLAGAILMLFGKSSYFIGAVVIAGRWFSSATRADLEAQSAAGRS